MNFYSAIKNKIMSFVGNAMELESKWNRLEIVLSGISQTQKKESLRFSLVSQ